MIANLSRDYIDLQMLFAETMADKSGRALTDTLLHTTNLYRRLGLGKPDATKPPSRLWLEFVAGIDAMSHAQRVEHATAFLANRPDGALSVLPGRIAFGCFACEAPDEHGAVRIHFGNRDASAHAAGVGPLHHTRLSARRAELTDMFGWLAREYPTARSVNGGSWLYNLESYRRLFPPAFGASRQLDPKFTRTNGLSVWGQFINHRGDVRPDVRDAFLAALPDLNPANPQGAFPCKTLFTRAPIADFHHLYGTEPG